MRPNLLASCALMLASCGQPSASGNTAASSATARATPSTALSASPSVATSAVDLSKYVGKYPFDYVDGVPFFRQPSVRDAVARAAPDPAVRRLLLGGNGPQTPIVRQGEWIVSWGCEAHNCGPHNWSLLIAPDGGKAEICYQDLSASPMIRWFADGRAEDRKDACPSGDNG